jgi:hypothetical protein
VTTFFEIFQQRMHVRQSDINTILFLIFTQQIIISFRGLGHLTCSSIDVLPLFPGTSTISSSSRFVVEGMFWESGAVHSFKTFDPVFWICATSADAAQIWLQHDV